MFYKKQKKESNFVLLLNILRIIDFLSILFITHLLLMHDGRSKTR
jgi:hypothetical protein